MAKKKVIVACGGAVATSTITANKVVELAKENGIDIEICQIRISEIASNLDSNTVLIVSTSRVKRDYGVPLISGMPFISGVKLEETKAAILKVLKERSDRYRELKTASVQAMRNRAGTRRGQRMRQMPDQDRRINMFNAAAFVINYVIDMGASIMFPIVIAIISIAIGIKVGKAVRSGLMM